MLDVMKRPPPVIEQITWTASRVKMPDDAETVLIFTAEDGVSEGWWDSANEQWMTIEGFPLAMVTWWAKLPDGPTEPMPGVLAHPKPLTVATLDHAVSMVFESDSYPAQVKRQHLETIVRTLLKSLGLACLGGSTVAIDLANGHSLMVQVKEDAEVPA